MELVQDLVQNQLVYVPVLLVIFGAILVFTFGFQSAKEPNFLKITNEERKQQVKKRKLKEKKVTSNGSIIIGQVKLEKSPQKELKQSPQKESDAEKKVKKADNTTNSHLRNEVAKEEAKSQKVLKKIGTKKPVDFDDGEWETVLSKSEKKKKHESPVKKEKKIKKSDAEKSEKDLIPNTQDIVPEINIDAEKINEEIEKIDKEPEKLDIVEKPILSIEKKTTKENKKEKKTKKKESVKVEAKIDEPEIVIVEENIKVEPLKDVAMGDKVKIEDNIKHASEEDKSKLGEDAMKSSSGIVFDELGDVWTEAKVAKKSKKKPRKDN